MLTTDELRALIEDHESDRVELTVSKTNTDKFGEAICAFANEFPNHRRPGYLIIGVHDDGTVDDQIVSDALLRDLGALRSNVNIEPLPTMTVQKYPLPEGDVAARDPLRWVPGAWIQFVRWAGTTMADDPISEKRFSGDLITVLRELETFVSLPAQPHPVVESALRERTVTDYPPTAIRELLLNAIMHRSYESNAPVRFYWYDDRIEIQNPGGLYGMASPENFPRQTDYRNPVLSEALATLGYVNAFGRGVIRAQEALHRNGNPEVEFTFEPSHVLATIGRAA